MVTSVKVVFNDPELPLDLRERIEDRGTTILMARFGTAAHVEGVFAEHRRIPTPKDDAENVLKAILEAVEPEVRLKLGPTIARGLHPRVVFE